MCKGTTLVMLQKPGIVQIAPMLSMIWSLLSIFRVWNAMGLERMGKDVCWAAIEPLICEICRNIPTPTRRPQERKVLADAFVVVIKIRENS